MNDGFVSGTPQWIKPIIVQEAQRRNLSTKLLSAQIKQESGFNPTAGSVAGARGVAQFIASTAKSYGLRVDEEVDERLDPEKAIRAQADYMADLLENFGSIERALSAYNSGNPDRYKDPSFKTWYGSVGETSKYVNSIVGQVNSPGDEEVNDVAEQPKGLIPQVLAAEAEPPRPQPSPPPTPMIGPLQQPQPGPVPSMTSQARQEFASTNVPQPNVSLTDQSRPSSYTVKPGDTLWGIAEQMGMGGENWKKLGFTGDPRKLPIGYQLNF